MAILFKNNAASTLTYKITDAQEVLYVADASVFPVIASDSGDVFKLTLVGEDTLEIVEAYAVYNPEGRQGFRIRRAQEGTTAQVWPAGTRVELRITADALNSFVPTAVQIAKDYVDATGVASTTNVGFAGVDGKTTQADAGGVITVKDVAIGGNASDLASARGQIGDNIRINTASDLNAYTKAGNWFFSDAAAKINFPTAGKGGELNCYVSTSAIFQFFTEFYNNRRYIRHGIPNSKQWSDWVQFVSVAQIGDGLTVNNGIISVPEYKGATASKAGTSGLVPPAAARQQESFLTGGGEYKPALTKISDSVSLTDSTTAASATAVKTAYDLANSKQPNLGFTPVQQSGGAGQEGQKIYIGWSPSGLKVQAAELDLGNIVTTSAGCMKAPSAANADYATSAGTLYINERPATWHWNGQEGQPEWLWGGNDGTNMYVYNPANFSVNYANSAYISTAVSGVWFGRNNQTVPSGGTWRVITSINGKVDFMTVAGGTSIPHDWWYAVRVA